MHIADSDNQEGKMKFGQCQSRKLTSHLNPQFSNFSSNVKSSIPMFCLCLFALNNSFILREWQQLHDHHVKPKQAKHRKKIISCLDPCLTRHNLILVISHFVKQMFWCWLHACLDPCITRHRLTLDMSYFVGQSFRCWLVKLVKSSEIYIGWLRKYCLTWVIWFGRLTLVKRLTCGLANLGDIQTGSYA
jgi:hypothetical protein